MVLLPLLGGVVALLYSRNQPVIYEARATLLVQQHIGGLARSPSDFILSEHLANTYSRQVRASPFLEKVVQKHINEITFGVGELKSMINATTGRNPPMVELRVWHNNPVIAADTADLLAREFIDYIVELRLAEIARLQSAAAAQGIINAQELVAAQFSAIDSLSLLEPVSTPSAPVLPRTRQNIVLGVLVGIVLVLGAVFLLESLGDTVRSPEDIARRFGVTSLGTVFRWSQQDASDQDLVLSKAPSSNYAESFRQVRANIQFATANQQARAFLVCSPGPGEGKSTIVCNLGIALAQLGKRVVIVDGDLRRASVHKRFESVKREPGLSSYLADFATDLDSIMQKTGVEGLAVIPSGPIPPNPAELLGSPKMKALLRELRDRFDYVMVDSAPILLVADGPTLASQVDGAIVVVDGSHTRSSSLRATLDALKKAQANIVGVVVNKLKRPRFGYGYSYPYYYYYSYNGYYGSDDSDHRSRNGHKKKLHQQPAHWMKAVVSRFQPRERAASKRH